MLSKGKRTVAKERRLPGRHREGKRCRVRDDRGDPRVREKWSALWQWWLDNVIPPVSVRESGECRRAVANGWKATGPALLSINFQNGIWSLKSKIQCKWCQNYLKICKKNCKQPEKHHSKIWAHDLKIKYCREINYSVSHIWDSNFDMGLYKLKKLGFTTWLDELCSSEEVILL